MRGARRSLCIAGTRPKPSGQGEDRTTYSERTSSRFFRLLNLVSEISTEKVNATVADGVLQVKLLNVGLGKKLPVLARTAGAKRVNKKEKCADSCEST